MKKQQSGFTLIELAIVLVIIGLLLGGVLKGQELINSAKVKNMATDFKNIQVYIYGYQDKFKALPGDDHSAATHVTGATNAANGSQNGIIQGQWNTATDGDESCVFWQHVRLAGLAPGSTVVNCAAGNTYQPRNADGGLIGLQSVSGFTKITGMSGAYAICSDAILGKFAKQLDTALDDGETSTGSFRAVLSATATGAGVASAAVVDSDSYTGCLTF
ncbi:MAG TPA: prepilin-type N-terminal cleavage/methylation domain-containing protein [Methylotenera sp.]|nr:prepilin-type N-terminal cleavage/methylation domain-containing protein [Methylotenera sp.]HPH06584.1 prepilin-type N-terminal cleavage/methylation domain-containing protein [Methylotenera sp.]